AAGVGNVGDFNDVFGHMPRASTFADSGFQGFDQVIGDGLAVGGDHEQDDFDVTVDLAANHEAVFDLADGFHLAVDFGGADSYAAGVEGGVGAAVDDGAAVFGELDEVAVGPDPGEGVEVGVLVALAVRVIPETHRHGGHRLATDQFAAAVADRLAVVAVGNGVHTEEAALDFAPAYRPQRGGANEAAADVGTAGDGAKQDVRGAVGVDPVVVFR